MEKKQKILFSDLDGTLLDDRKEIEQSAKQAVDELLLAGNFFAICTGRPLTSAMQVARQFNLNRTGCYTVAFNGGVLYDPSKGQIISYASIPRGPVLELMQKAREAGLYAHTYDRADDTILTESHLPELDFYIQTTKLAYKAKEGCVRQCLKEDPPKVIVASLTGHDRLVKFQQENAAWTKDFMTSFFSCDEYLEYCPIGATKGMGLKKLCEYLDIPVENSVAAGDERNDVALLQMAGTSAVPANAHPDARAFADYICEKDNNQGAVGEIVRRFILD